MSNRLNEWEDFSARVGRHIETYTVPQYGDSPGDPLSDFTDEEIIAQMKRYINRASSNVRGPAEAQRDMLKVAHYAGVLFTKRAERAVVQ